MGLVASSVVMTVIVLNIHHQPIKSRRLSSILREGKSFLFLARLLCVGRPVKTPRKFAKLSAHAYQMTPSFMNGSVADAAATAVKNCYGNKNVASYPVMTHLEQKSGEILILILIEIFWVQLY